jgi:hypothetical protein
VPALADQVQVDLAQRRQPPVRVVDQVRLLRPALDPVRHLELVVAGRPGQHRGEHAAGVHLRQVVPAVGEDGGDPAGVRAQRAYHQLARIGPARVGTGLERAAVGPRRHRLGGRRDLVDRARPGVRGRHRRRRLGYGEADRVQPEDRVRVVVHPADEPVELLPGDSGGVRGELRGRHDRAPSVSRASEASGIGSHDGRLRAS